MFLSAYRASPTGRSILFLKLVLIFLCSLKPSHSTPSIIFLFRIFGDNSTSPEAKQNRRNDAASLCHVSCYHSNNMNIFAFRVTGHDVVTPAQWQQKISAFSPHSDLIIGLFVPYCLEKIENERNRQSTNHHQNWDVIQRTSGSQQNLIKMWQSKHRIDLAKINTTGLKILPFVILWRQKP